MKREFLKKTIHAVFALLAMLAIVLAVTALRYAIFAPELVIDIFG